MARPRRLIIQTPDGGNLMVEGHLIGLDLTGIPNADVRAGLQVKVEQQCDLLCWHEMSSGTDLPLWSD